MNEIKEPYQLIQSIVDAQENLIIVIEDDKPILMNRSCCTFFGVKNFEEYSQSFGSFENNFVPHPSYFNAGKVEDGESWLEALERLDEKDKIVSMLSTSDEPRAFSVAINHTHPFYSVVSMHDISANLIKRIMIENDVSLDKESGAYNKEYFLYTAEILQDAAAYNEKEIGLTMLKLLDHQGEDLKRLVGNIKESIRENDMLVKYASNILLIACLVDKEENAMLFGKKLRELLISARSERMNFNIAVSLVKKGEKLGTSLKRLNNAIDDEQAVNRLQLI